MDANTYSITGDSFSTIVLPGEHSQTSVTLQEDDCSLGKQCTAHTFLPRIAHRTLLCADTLCSIPVVAAYEFGKKVHIASVQSIQTSPLLYQPLLLFQSHCQCAVCSAVSWIHSRK